MIIEANELGRDYQVYVNRDPGARGFQRFLRQRKKICALQSLNLEIDEGEIVGLIGENGSGKSTTIKLLTGILQPTSGSTRVSGLDPFKNRIQNARNISAIMGQKTQLWWDLPVYRSFEMLKATYNIPEQEFLRRQAEFTEMLKLAELMKKPVRTLSLGQRVRCDIVAGLLHQPKVLFLDEPTIGLDYKVKSELYRFLRFCNDQFRTTIILTSHDLEDVETLCDRLVVLEKGRRVLDQSMSTFMRRLGGDRLVTVQSSEPSSFSQDFGVEQSRTDKEIRVAFNSTEHADIDVFRAVSKHMDASDINIEKIALRDILTQIEKSPEDVE